MLQVSDCQASQDDNESKDGSVVRALASHQCVPGLIPGPGIICGLSLLLVLFLDSRGFSMGPPKNQYFQIPIQSGILTSTNYPEPVSQVIAQALPVIDIKFTFFTTNVVHLSLITSQG